MTSTMADVFSPNYVLDVQSTTLIFFTYVIILFYFHVIKLA